MRHVQSMFTPATLATLLLIATVPTIAQEPRADSRLTSSAQSTVDELHALVHADKFTELIAKVDALKSQDPNWKGVLELLLEAAERHGDYTYVKRKAKYVFDVSSDVETRATAAFALATGCWRSGELRDAEAAFAEVARILPDSELAQAATWNIHEIKNLAVGQKPPAFVAQTTSGEQLSLDQLRGKVVLLHFWASW